MSNKIYHINLEIQRVQLSLAMKGLIVYDMVSKKGDPYLFVEDKVALFFSWETKKWTASNWGDSMNTTLTQTSKEKIGGFVLGYFNDVLGNRFGEGYSPC